MTVQAISGLMKSPTSLYTDQTPGSMDKTDFLNLLITQIQQQDPLNPQDPSEFTAQLTQFSSLEQMMNMNTSIQNLQALQLSSNNTMAASLIGKDVIYSGDTMTIAGSKANDIRFDSPVCGKQRCRDDHR